MKELIRLDALVEMRDMNVRARCPATRSASYWEKIYFDPLFSENASKNTAFLFKCLILSDVTTQSTMKSSDVYYLKIRDFT